VSGGRKRGFVSFLLVLLFIPVAMQSLGVWGNAEDNLGKSKQVLLEQQHISNIENDVKASFIFTMKRSAELHGDKEKLVEDLQRWTKHVEGEYSGVEVWCGYIDSNYWKGKAAMYGFDEISNFVDVQDNYAGVFDNHELPGRGEDMRAVIGINIRVGNSSSTFLIPEGTSVAYERTDND
jgi:hypothetical protein